MSIYISMTEQIADSALAKIKDLKVISPEHKQRVSQLMEIIISDKFTYGAQAHKLHEIITTAFHLPEGESNDGQFLTSILDYLEYVKKNGRPISDFPNFIDWLLGYFEGFCVCLIDAEEIIDDINLLAEHFDYQTANVARLAQYIEQCSNGGSLESDLEPLVTNYLIKFYEQLKLSK